MGPSVRPFEESSPTLPQSFGLWEALLTPPPWPPPPSRTCGSDEGTAWAAVPPLPPPSDKDTQGIAIPALLQPLFGLDFVPYLPSPTAEDGEDGTTTTTAHALIAEQDLHQHPPPSQSLANPVWFHHASSIDTQDDTETELEEIDAVLVAARHPTSPLPKEGKKKRDQRKLLPKAWVKTLSSIKKKNAAARLGPPPKQSDSGSGTEEWVATNSTTATATTTREQERTPRRRGRPQLVISTDLAAPGGARAAAGAATTNVVVASSRVSPQPAPTTYSSSSSSTTVPPGTAPSMDQQWHTLQSLHQQAVHIRKQARATEDRIAALVHDATQLQQALATVYGQMNAEQSRLTAIQTQLHQLNDRVHVATQQGCWTPPAAHPPEPQPPPTRSSRPRPLPPVAFARGRPRSRTESRSPQNSWHTVRANSLDDSAGGHTPSRYESTTATGATTTTRTPHTHGGQRRRANTDPPSLSHALLKSSTSFMRVNDLELQSTSSTVSIGSSWHSLDDATAAAATAIPSGISSSPCMTTPPGTSPTGSDDGLFLLDENLPFILSRLTDLGLHMSTDETERFSPVSDTSRIVQQKKSLTHQPLEGWPYSPWHVAKDKDILLWTGGVPHKGFGHDWPVVKARCIVRTSPRELLDFLLDSSQLKRYNKMSQGREDVLVLQDGVDTRAEDSPYGFPGDARILRALNKPKLLPKVIEMLSLWYSRTLPDAAPNAYMTVSRSVWENASGTPQNNNHRLRSEMLLGVNLLRPCPQGCELTTITHVFAPGVPEMMAKRVAPQSAANMMREIQNIFAKR